jgi:hypothetical protein
MLDPEIDSPLEKRCVARAMHGALKGTAKFVSCRHNIMHDADFLCKRSSFGVKPVDHEILLNNCVFHYVYFRFVFQGGWISK